MIMFGGLLTAQDKPKEKTPESTKDYEAAIIPVKTLTGDSFNRLSQMLRVFQVQYSSDEKLRTIVVYAPKNVTDQIRRVVAELDKPGSEAAIGRNIEMNMTFLRCWPKSPGAIQPLPPEMEAVAKQLRSATQYKDFEIWDSFPLRLQEGKDTEQSIRLPMTGNPEFAGALATAQIRIRPEAVTTKDTGRFVRFDRLNIGFRIPYVTGRVPSNSSALVSTQFQFMEVGLNTAGEYKEGQKSVLGKLSGVESDSAIFVVITLKVLE